MENSIFHSLILFLDWRCGTLLLAVQHYRTGTLSASSLRSAPGGSSPPLTDLFWSVRHSLRAMRKGAARPLTPGRVDNPAPVVSRFLHRLTPSGILLACVFMIFCADLFFIDFADIDCRTDTDVSALVSLRCDKNYKNYLQGAILTALLYCQSD